MAALYSTFISGLTLLQALAIQRDIIPHRRSARGIRACTSVLVTYATLFPEARMSTLRLISAFELMSATESFRIAFDDLIDGMEDEVADEREEQTTAIGHPRDHNQALGEPPLDQASVYAEIAGQPQCSASSAWQRKVLDVEARLQGDLQQDLARSVFTKRKTE